MLKFALCLANLIISFTLFQSTYGVSSEYRVGQSVGASLNFVSFDNLNPVNETASPYDNQTSNVQKVAIIIFDRGDHTQFTNAKPILDKYGFKASFFIICSFIDGDGYYKLLNGSEVLDKSDDPMNWDQIRTLYNEGHDIQSHGMQHRYLRNLSSQDLVHEISESKECLENQGLNPTYFQIPSNRGAENVTILKTISKYFDFGLSGHSKLMFLNCDGWVNHGFKTRSYKYQKDCNPYSEEGLPTRTHKYAIREWSHDRYHTEVNNNLSSLRPHGKEISNMLFSGFVNLVEAQKLYNERAGKIVAIPIVGYHGIDKYNNYDTSEKLFDREMKYLYDNGYKVLTLTDLGYDQNENRFYIK